MWVSLPSSDVKRNKAVKLIEPNRERAAKLAEMLQNVLVIHGAATDIDLLVQEGLGEMDAFVAVTDDEESNLVTCLMAKHLGVRKTVALLSKNTYIPISQSIAWMRPSVKTGCVSRDSPVSAWNACTERGYHSWFWMPRSSKSRPNPSRG